MSLKITITVEIDSMTTDSVTTLTKSAEMNLGNPAFHAYSVAERGSLLARELGAFIGDVHAKPANEPPSKTGL